MKSTIIVPVGNIGYYQAELFIDQPQEGHIIRIWSWQAVQTKEIGYLTTQITKIEHDCLLASDNDEPQPKLIICKPILAEFKNFGKQADARSPWEFIEKPYKPEIYLKNQI